MGEGCLELHFWRILIYPLQFFGFLDRIRRFSLRTRQPRVDYSGLNVGRIQGKNPVNDFGRFRVVSAVELDLGKGNQDGNRVGYSVRKFLQDFFSFLERT